MSSLAPFIAAIGGGQLSGQAQGVPVNEQPTLRDRFAMATLTGICADPRVDGKPADIAIKCYRMADAMLKARAK